MPDLESLMERDFQWVDEVVSEATALFKKEDKPEEEEDNPDNTGASDVAPVLLPQTPRVRLSSKYLEFPFQNF